MQKEQIVFVGTSDLSGRFRGKSFPAVELPARQQHGIGLAPTNLFISAFGPIQFTPFGTQGEVFLIPDPSTRVFVPFEGGAAEFFLLGDIRTFEGDPWAYCPRHALRRALDALRDETGFRLLATFEQEFLYSGVPDNLPQPYELDGYRRQGIFGEALIAAVRQAGIVPDSFLCEYGRQQFEITLAPAIGLRAADEAVITREMAQAVAWRLGQRVSFTPIPEPDGVGNGTHIHFSFLDAEDRPALYAEHEARGLAPIAQKFVAGILHHLPAICAVTTPSVSSYYRLRPNRWAPVRADVGVLDRGAAVRICPAPGGDAAQRAARFNVEFRVADATANPYLVLAVLVQAGLDGIRAGRSIDAAAASPLPDSLAAALTLLERTPSASDWLGPDLLAGYLQFKRAEDQGLAGLDEQEICRRYAACY